MKAKQQPKPAPVEVPPPQPEPTQITPYEGTDASDELRISNLTEVLRAGLITSIKRNMEYFCDSAGLNDLQLMDQVLTFRDANSLYRSEEPSLAFAFMLATDYDRIIEERRAKLDAAA